MNFYFEIGIVSFCHKYWYILLQNCRHAVMFYVDMMLAISFKHLPVDSLSFQGKWWRFVRNVLIETATDILASFKRGI